MQLENSSPINTSKSKVVYRFSRDTRFKPLKLIHEKVGYDRKTDFEKIVRNQKTGHGTRFGGSSRRFEYQPSKRKQGMFPSSAEYSTHGLKTRQGNDFNFEQKQSKGSTFGESRYKLIKLHVDAIMKSGDVDKPGPAFYNKSLEWKIPRDNSFSKTTPQYSFGQRNHHMEKLFIKSQRASPGPGFYGESSPRNSLRDSVNLKGVLAGRHSSIDRTELST